MKKLFLLSGLLLMGCAETIPLGHPDFNSQNKVAVFYDRPPQNCQQLGVTMFSGSYWVEDLATGVEQLKEEAKLAGGNYVDIKTYSHENGFFTLRGFDLTGVIYRCP